MVQGRLHELLLAGDRCGALPAGAPGIGAGSAHHPVCGDEVTLHVQVAGGLLTDVRWQARACPAATAIAALAAADLVGATSEAAADNLAAAVAGGGGLAAHERHALPLVQRALAAALAAAREAGR
jgi:NifU-like protein involved in Fe-S cluster formation